ncbi:MAG: hypothetical protein NTW94_02120 [Legionellales bacterium]|nr:hypothetical protein [Legionellales bacterium]
MPFPLDTAPKRESFKNSNFRGITKSLAYDICPIARLPYLIEQMKSKTPDEKCLRYLVDTENKLWFALEGPGGGHYTPCHYQMTGEPSSNSRCIAVGNIEISDKAGGGFQVAMLNHKSGDFSPNFDTLQWVLGILLANEKTLSAANIFFAPHLSLEKLTSRGGTDETFSVTKSELDLWLPETFDSKTIDSFKAQPTELKHVTYDPPVRAERKREGREDDKSLSSDDLGLPRPPPKCRRAF